MTTPTPSQASDKVDFEEARMIAHELIVADRANPHGAHLPMTTLARG